MTNARPPDNSPSNTPAQHFKEPRTHAYVIQERSGIHTMSVKPKVVTKSCANPPISGRCGPATPESEKAMARPIAMPTMLATIGAISAPDFLPRDTGLSLRFEITHFHSFPEDTGQLAWFPIKGHRALAR